MNKTDFDYHQIKMEDFVEFFPRTEYAYCGRKKLYSIYFPVNNKTIFYVVIDGDTDEYDDLKSAIDGYNEFLNGERR